MEPLFSNHFYFTTTPTGRALLGLPKEASTIAVTQNQANGEITRFGTTGLIDNAGLIQPATVSVVVPVMASRSLLQTLESRQSVHVETDLPIMRTIIANNGAESSAYDLCSFALKNESSSRVHMDGLKVTSNVDFITQTHCGQLIMQSRNEQPTQWSPVLSVDDLKSFRCGLYLKTRDFDAASGKWVVSKKQFTFDIESDYWSIGLRFVSMD
jgi:hypothetical protein